LLKELSLFIKVNIITADKRGLPITLKRVEDEMEMELDVVTGKAIERWNWIREKYPSQKIIFIGDGWNDYYALKKSDLGITTIDALQHVKDSADVVLKRAGGDRFVAEAVLFIAKHYDLFRVLQ
jgi:soluble P-type ATPase